MARKRMFFSSEKAVRELGYRWRAPAKAFEDARQKPTLAGESAAGMQGRCAEGEIRKIDTNQRTLAVPGRRSAHGISFWWRGKDTGKMPAIRHWAGCTDTRIGESERSRIGGTKTLASFDPRRTDQAWPTPRTLSTA
jgi:hypothetical protein